MESGQKIYLQGRLLRTHNADTLETTVVDVQLADGQFVQTNVRNVVEIPQAPVAPITEADPETRIEITEAGRAALAPLEKPKPARNKAKQ